MNISEIVVMICRFVIIALYGFEMMRYNRGKRIDDTLKLKFDVRSWIEIVVVGVLNIGFIIYPDLKANVSFLTFYGFVMLIVTFYHTRRIVAWGKKVIFILEHSFYVKDITRVKYEKGRLSFLLKGQPFKLRMPLTDMKALEQKFAGKNFR